MTASRKNIFHGIRELQRELDTEDATRRVNEMKKKVARTICAAAILGGVVFSYGIYLTATAYSSIMKATSSYRIELAKETEERKNREYESKLFSSQLEEEKKKNASLEQRIEQLQKDDSSNKEKITSLSNQVGPIQEKVNSYEEELDKYKQKDTANSLEISKLRADIAQLQADATKYNNDINQLNSSLSERIAELNEVKGDRTSKTILISAYEKKIQLSDKELAELRKAKSDLEKSVGDYNINISELEKKKDEQSAEITRLQYRTVELNENLTEARKELEKLRKKTKVPPEPPERPQPPVQPEKQDSQYFVPFNPEETIYGYVIGKLGRSEIAGNTQRVFYYKMDPPDERDKDLKDILVDSAPYQNNGRIKNVSYGRTTDGNNILVMNGGTIEVKNDVHNRFSVIDGNIAVGMMIHSHVGSSQSLISKSGEWLFILDNGWLKLTVKNEFGDDVELTSTIPLDYRPHYVGFAIENLSRKLVLFIDGKEDKHCAPYVRVPLKNSNVVLGPFTGEMDHVEMLRYEK